MPVLLKAGGEQQPKNLHPSECHILMHIFGGTRDLPGGYVVDTVDSNSLKWFEIQKNDYGEDYSYLVGTLSYGQFEQSILPERPNVVEDNYRGLGLTVVEMGLTYSNGSYMAGVLIHNEKQFLRIVGEHAERWGKLLATFSKR